MTHSSEANDKLTDVIDIAGEAEANARDHAVAAVQRKAKPRQAPRADGTFEFLDCEECGCDIGEGRLRVAIMNHLCIHCATAKEKRK